MDELDLPDGTRCQSSLSRARTHGSLPEFSLYGILVECVVVAVRVPGDKDNRTGCVEYDCDPLVPGFSRITDVRKLEAVNGLDDGDTNILRVGANTLTGGPWAKDQTDARARSDGDRVIIAFLNGSKDQPIIVGCLPSEDARYDNLTPPTPVKRVRRKSHRGTSVEIDESGNVKIKAKNSSDLKHPAPATAKTIAIGTTADQPVVLGTALMTEISALTNTLKALATALQVFATAAKADTVATTTAAAALALELAIVTTTTVVVNLTASKAKFDAAVPSNTMLSTWIKTSKGPT
jgi:hypothetical protein